MLATGDSLFRSDSYNFIELIAVEQRTCVSFLLLHLFAISRTGVNTLGGGGRILMATAGVPFAMAESAVQRLRDMF